MDTDVLHANDSGSDLDIDSGTFVPRIPEAPRDGATLEDFRMAFKDTQLALGQARNEIRRLAREAATLRVELAAIKSKGSAKSRAAPDDPESLEVKMLGKKFCVMGELWIADDVFRVPRPATNSSDPHRYDSDLTVRLGVIAELYEFVPSKFHDRMLRDPDFGRQFSRGLQDVRATLLNKIRSNASLVFDLPQHGNDKLRVPAAYFLLDYDRATVPEFQKLLKSNVTQSVYPPFPPILYPDNDKSPKKIFRNPILPRILRFVLFGSNSLDGKASRGKTNGKLWNVDRITEGAIAWSAIMARFILSPDKEFNSKGSETGIDYRQDFKKYKKLLITQRETKPIQDLLAWWDANVLSSDRDRRNPKIPAADGDGEYIDIEDAIRGLNLESDSDDQSVEFLDRAPSVERRAIAAVPNPVPIAAAQVAGSSHGPENEDAPRSQPAAISGPPITATPSSTTAQRPNENASGNGPKGRGKGRGRGKGKSSADVPATRATRSRVSRQTIPLPVDSELEIDEDGL